MHRRKRRRAKGCATRRCRSSWTFLPDESPFFLVQARTAPAPVGFPRPVSDIFMSVRNQKQVGQRTPKAGIDLWGRCIALPRMIAIIQECFAR
jgi:hypothetical protein